ncbi:MAG: LacI family DNA-binding transcriptional regulator [Pseudomonadota bacterium]
MAGRTPHRKRVNLRDVARLAGVSVATVSRVLNAPSLVQEATRVRVQMVIDEVGFVRSAAARAINSGRTQILGALIPTLENDIFAMTLNAMEKRLVDLGFSLIVATTDEDPATEERKVRELLDNGVEGLFLTGTTHTEAVYDMLNRWRVPAVAISCFDPTFRLPTIGYNNFAAARLAYAFLVKSKPANIAVVHGPIAFNDRTAARLSAIDDVSGPNAPTRFETELSVAGGAQAASRMLQSSSVFDAVLCLSDVLAYGVLHEVQRAGLHVPRDLSLMGLQDLPASEFTYPKLTTVHLPVRRMGRQAAESMAAWVTDNIPATPVEFQATLTLRGSTRAPSRVS